MIKGAFAGLACLDITYYQNEFPNENFKSKTTNYQTFIGGPAANAAITYAILGGEATFITCLGNSTIAQAIKAELTDVYQIKVIDLAYNADVLPSIASILVNTENATRTIWSGQQQFDIPENTNYEQLIHDANFCFSDCNLPEVTVQLLQTARDIDKPIILDPGSWKPHFPICLPLADEIIASVNCHPAGSDLVEFLQGTSVKSLAITDGGNSTKWYDQLIFGEINIPLVEVVDTLAAGDVLHGAYCYYRYHEGLPFVEALKRSSLVATESVKFVGARKGVYEMVGK